MVNGIWHTMFNLDLELTLIKHTPCPLIALYFTCVQSHFKCHQDVESRHVIQSYNAQP